MPYIQAPATFTKANCIQIVSLYTSVHPKYMHFPCVWRNGDNKQNGFITESRNGNGFVILDKKTSKPYTPIQIIQACESVSFNEAIHKYMAYIQKPFTIQEPTVNETHFKALHSYEALKSVIIREDLQKFATGRNISRQTLSEYTKPVQVSKPNLRPSWGIGLTDGNKFFVRHTSRNYKHSSSAGHKGYLLHTTSEKLVVVEGIFDLLAVVEMCKAKRQPIPSLYMIHTKKRDLSHLPFDPTSYKECVSLLDKGNTGVEWATDKSHFFKRLGFGDIAEYWQAQKI